MTNRDVGHGSVADEMAGEVEVVLVLGPEPAEQEVRQQHGELLPLVIRLL